MTLARRILQNLGWETVPGRQIASGRPVLFLHIPKTGGITFRNILQEIYGNSFVYCDDPRVAEIRKLLTPGACVEMHVGVWQGREQAWFHSELFQEPNWPILADVDIFVMFRNPLDQAMSAYRYYLQTLKDRAQSRGVRVAETFEEFFAISYTRNMQLTFLLGKTEAVTKGLDLTTDDLDQAKRLIQELRMKVGILERYAESMQLFEAVTGQQLPKRTIAVQNRSHPEDVDDDPSAREFICAGNKLDRDLYEFASRVFNGQLADWKVSGLPNFAFA